MRVIACFALWLILRGVAGAEPQAIIDTDFGAPGKPFETITAARGVRITGRLPDGWSDNSEWKSNVVAEYKPMSEGRRPFLRVEQASGDGLQFMHRLPALDDASAYYRLTLTARSLAGAREIVFYRLRRPRYWGKDAPDSFFGTHTLSTNRHLAMTKAVGANWVRPHDAGTEYIGWSFLEPEKGK